VSLSNWSHCFLARQNLSAVDIVNPCIYLKTSITSPRKRLYESDDSSDGSDGSDSSDSSDSSDGSDEN